MEQLFFKFGLMTVFKKSITLYFFVKVLQDNQVNPELQVVDGQVLLVQEANCRDL